MPSAAALEREKRKSCQELKSFSERIDWESQEVRVVVLDRLDALLGNESYWKTPPNLLDTFTHRQVELLLTDHVKRWWHRDCAEKVGFVERVAKTGYRDQGPEVNDEKSLRRDTPLHVAARGPLNEKDLVEALFKIYDKFGANYSDEFGCTHFEIACVYDCTDALEKFLEAGQNPNFVRKKPRDTPLHCAVRGRKWELVERLLRRGADPSSDDAHGSTALHTVCRDADANSVERFLRMCDGVGSTTVRIDATDNQDRTPLHLAVLELKWSAVETLLRRGADPIAADSHGRTPLHALIERESDFSFSTKGSAPTLIEHRLKRCINVRDKSANAPLHLALSQGRVDYVEWLLRNGADPNLPGWLGSTPLHVVCKTHVNDAVVIEHFLGVTDRLQREVRFDARDRWGQTPLHSAVIHNNEAAIEFLARRDGVDANLANAQGKTPLHLALAKGREKLAELLLRLGADPNLADEEGSTPLHYICLQPGQAGVDLAKEFFRISEKVGRPVRIDAKDAKGRTPLQLAVVNLSLGQVEYLLARGADPTLVDVEGSTPLHYICLQPGQGGVDSAKEFFRICEEVDWSVRIDAKDSRGWTPLQLAVANLSLGLVEYLLARGADVAGFVFPADFADRIGSPEATSANRKLELVWRALSIVERLGGRGYRLCQRDATATMKLLDAHRLLSIESSRDLRQLCRHDEAFRAKAQKFKIGWKLTLHELIHLPIELASKKLTSMSNSTWAQKLSRLGEEFGAICDSYLCEILLRNFCLRWAMEPLRALMRGPKAGTPVEICQMIFEHLANQDLCNICLATAAAAAPLESINAAAKSGSTKEDAKIIRTAPKRLRRSSRRL